MPIRRCTVCNKTFKAPPHQPGKPAVTVRDRHAEKPKPRKKTEPDQS